MTDDEVTTGANGQEVEIQHIDGRDHEIDIEIAGMVRALNDAGYITIASCSGHDVLCGVISLKDGRELIIAKDFEEARSIVRFVHSTRQADENTTFQSGEKK